jgi:hypothetical protein
VLTARERAVLAGMAEGRSDLGIAPTDTEHRRVQAVLTYLRHRHRRG